LIVTLGVALAFGTTATDPSPEVALASGDTVTAETPLRLVQANLRAGMRGTAFLADMGTVRAQAPDFITFNEVDGRHEDNLAPAPYELFRAEKTGNVEVDKYTRETAVGWDASTWTPLASGTWQISNDPDKYDWQNRSWGIRYANWVTLTNAAGRVVSVISVHIAPEIAILDGIQARSLRRLGALADQLDDKGPVLIGGDLNVNYREVQKYPRSLMAELDLTPTYDVLTTSLPTGDERGATIDYVLLRSASRFGVKQHYTRELNSDHDLLGADVSLLTEQVGMWASGIVVSDPDTAPLRAMRTAARAINKMPAGSVLHLSARTISRSPVLRAIVAAKERGVRIQLVFGDRTPTRAIKAFMRQLGTDAGRKNFAVNRPRAYTRKGLPSLQVLASESGGTPGVRVDVNRPPIPASSDRVTTAWIYTDGVAYDSAFRVFFAAAGRPL
jgi:endonuclease/exonuclease/phosphatase family metal-dependent hydrolase